MTKIEVLKLIYSKKDIKDFSKEEKQEINKYYTDDQVLCMNMHSINIESCIKLSPQGDWKMGGLIDK